MPDHRARSAAQLDEERRLLYVAVTRTRKDLLIYHAPAKIHEQRSKRFSRVSRFLKSALDKKFAVCEAGQRCLMEERRYRCVNQTLRGEVMQKGRCSDWPTTPAG